MRSASSTHLSRHFGPGRVREMRHFAVTCGQKRKPPHAWTEKITNYIAKRRLIFVSSRYGFAIQVVQG